MTSSDPACREPIDTIVVLGSTLTALALVRSVHRLGLKVHVLDTVSGIAMKSRYPEKTVFQQGTDSSILNVLKKAGGPNSALIADSDRWLRFLLRYAVQINDIFGKVLHPGVDILALCLDKVEFLSWCRAKGLPAPRLYDADNLNWQNAEDILPLIIRPEETQHSIGTPIPKAVYIETIDEYRGWIAAYKQADVRPVVCQSVLTEDMQQFSVCFARRKSGETLSMVTEKIRPFAERCRGGSYVMTCDMPKIQNLGEKAINRLNFHGIGEVEILHDPKTEKSWLIEINARPWVQFPLAAKKEFNLLAFLLNRTSSGHNQAEKAWLWFAADFYECFAAGGLIRQGRLTWKNYLRSILRSESFAFWDLRDPRPFLNEFGQFMGVLVSSGAKKMTHKRGR